MKGAFTSSAKKAFFKFDFILRDSNASFFP